MEMVRLELQRMAANVERMGSDGVSSISGMMGQLDARLDVMRDSMVTREAYDRLFDRIRQLEVGVEAAEGAVNEERAFEGDAFLDEHSGHTGEDGHVNDYGYFDRDGNYIESEDEQEECED